MFTVLFVAVKADSRHLLFHPLWLKKLKKKPSRWQGLEISLKDMYESLREIGLFFLTPSLQILGRVLTNQTIIT